MRPPEPFTFFIDRSLGAVAVASALRAAGEQVVTHDERFAQDTDDVVWLAEAARSGWVVLTKDKDIRRNELERAAVMAHGIAVFTLGRGNLTGAQMAAAFVAALPRMKRALRRFEPPFVATVTASGAVSVIMDPTGLLPKAKAIG